MYENSQQTKRVLGSSIRQTTLSPNTTHSQINKEKVNVSSLRKKIPSIENTSSIRTSKTKLFKYTEINDEENQHYDEDEYLEEENTDMESPVMVDSCHEQQGNKKLIKPSAIFSSLREMQAEMKSLSSIQDDLLQSSHDENSDISVLIEDVEEIKPGKKQNNTNRKQVVIETYCDTEDDQIENTDIEEEEEEEQYIPKKQVVSKPPTSVNQLLEKHRRENEERKKQGATPFTFDDISQCSDDETTQIELTETEDNVNTMKTRPVSVKGSTETKIPPKAVVSEIAQQVIAENQAQKKITPNVTFASPEPSDVSPIIAPKLPKAKETSQPQIKKQRPINQQPERIEDDRVRVEKKKRDLEKDVLLRDYERRLASLSNQVVEYEALLEAHEERTSTIEREKDLELQALRGLYEEKWIEFKQKEKEWNERIITSCNESADLSSKTKKQNEQLLQLRQKLQAKTDEANQLQKTLKEKETEWKEKEKSYVNIRKRYDELLNHSREIKKHAEQLGTEVNDLRKYNEELSQKIDETVKNHKVKSKELKEKNEKLTSQ